MNPDVKRAVNDGLGWKDEAGLYVRNYTDYEAYLIKQASKLDGRLGWCQKRSEELRVTLGHRLKVMRIEAGLSVLCLGARLGGEVQAFIDIGCFAIGLDLNPGAHSMYVIHGDFHQLQFADSSINIVYINCFDHCLEPAKLLAEIHRVLKYKGRLILESKAGSDEPEIKCAGSDSWDCLEADSVQKLSQIIQDNGFIQEKAYKITRSKATPFGFIFGKL